MSLTIDTDHVSAVLLADGWHPVTAGSFDIDAFEFLYWPAHRCKDLVSEAVTVHSGGQRGICAAGFTFRTDQGDQLAGPLTAVLAVRYTNQPCANPDCYHDQKEAAA